MNLLNKGYDREVLLQQYLKYIDSIEQTTNNRTKLNTLFTSLNSLLFVSFNLVKESAPSNYINVSFGILGILLCIAWIINIKSFKQLNKIKFKVLCEIENKLSANIYDYEWSLLKNEYSYFRQNKAQQLIPILFIIVFFILFASGLPCIQKIINQ